MAEFKRRTLAEQLLEGKADTNAKPSGDDLESRLDRDEAPIWHPQPGEKLIGRVVELEWKTGDYEPHPLVTLVDDDGNEMAVRASATVLRNALERLRVQIGDKIAIRYNGERKSQAGRSYRDFRVVKDQKAGEDFWSLAEEGNPPF